MGLEEYGEYGGELLTEMSSDQIGTPYSSSLYKESSYNPDDESEMTHEDDVYNVEIGIVY